MGGRGSSGALGGGFSNGAGAPTESKSLYPAYFNKQGRFASVSGAEKIFSDKYKNADREYAISVDREGFVHSASVGEKHSVRIATTGKEQTIIHNHPSGSNFSGQDLRTFRDDKNIKTIKAVGRERTFSITKTNGFDQKKFGKACNNAKWPKQLSYTDGADWWLKRNQKALKYKYESYKTK